MSKPKQGWVFTVAPSGFGWAVKKDLRVIRRFVSRHDAEQMLRSLHRHPEVRG